MNNIADNAFQKKTAEQAKLTVTQKVMLSYENGLGGSNFSILFSILKDQGLVPLGKSNTDTLLFQYRNSGKSQDILAFRRKPYAILSFPKSYWSTRSADLILMCKDFHENEKLLVHARVGSTSQQSAGQLFINTATLQRLKNLCVDICKNIKSKSNQT